MGGPRRRRLAAALVVLLLALAAGPALVTRVAVSRIEATAGGRGLAVRWRSIRPLLPARMSLRGIVVTRAADGDTLFRAESLDVALDPWALLVLHPRVGMIAVSHATFRAPGRAPVDPDTLAPEETDRAGGHPRERGDRTETGGRVRRSADAIVRLLNAPARRLPQLVLRDVAIAAPTGADAFWSGARITWLDLHSTPHGLRLGASGSIAGERDLPFDASLLYARNDRLTGGARIGVPGDGRRLEEVRVSVDGSLIQDRRTGTVTLHDTSRVRVGELPFTIGARISRRGPRIRLRCSADGLTEERLKASLPPTVLGPLLEVGVRGSWDYRFGFDLDLAQPDRVSFAADVIPHGLSLDAGRTRLRLQGLAEPFVAAIHLPRNRVVTRDLSPANPRFRPLAAIAPALVHAVVTNEDGGFFHHRGFNPEAVKDAIAENLRAGAFRRGAGTITMQLVRNLYLGHERTLSRKFREVVLAWVLEHLTDVPKERLLEIYLNIIEWGPDVHGADEAARYYFDRDAGALTVDEALFLATVVPAPTKWRTRFDAAGALRPFVGAQMHFIGRAMVARGWLAPEELAPADSFRVELRGPARAVLMGDRPAVAAESLSMRARSFPGARARGLVAFVPPRRHRID